MPAEPEPARTTSSTNRIGARSWRPKKIRPKPTRWNRRWSRMAIRSLRLVTTPYISKAYVATHFGVQQHGWAVAKCLKSFGWGTWIRTRNNGVRVRGSTVNLFPSRRCRAGGPPKQPRVPCSRRRKIVKPALRFNCRCVRAGRYVSPRLYCECSKNSTTISAISSGMIR